MAKIIIELTDLADGTVAFHITSEPVPAYGEMLTPAQALGVKFCDFMEGNSTRMDITLPSKHTGKRNHGNTH